MNNYIFSADLHVRSNRPQFRKDDYFKTACGKVRQIISLCNKHNADWIVAGDFFDSVKVSYTVTNTILKYLKKLKGKCIVVAGQHDMSFHRNSLISSPLGTLIFADKMVLLKSDAPYMNKGDVLYGCSFGEEPVKPKEKGAMLVIHQSITLGEPPFFLTDAISHEEAFDRYRDYSMIVAGDFHQSFSCFDDKNNTALVNCGPMLRQSIDQVDMEPVVWLSDANGIEPIKLKIEPAEEVFAIEEIKQKEDSKFSQELEELVKTLKDRKQKPDYRNNVDVLMKQGNVKDRTREKVNYIFGSVKDDG